MPIALTMLHVDTRELREPNDVLGAVRLDHVKAQLVAGDQVGAHMAYLAVENGHLRQRGAELVSCGRELVATTLGDVRLHKEAGHRR